VGSPNTRTVMCLSRLGINQRGVTVVESFVIDPMPRIIVPAFKPMSIKVANTLAQIRPSPLLLGPGVVNFAGFGCGGSCSLARILIKKHAEGRRYTPTQSSVRELRTR